MMVSKIEHMKIFHVVRDACVNFPLVNALNDDELLDLLIVP